MVEVVGSASIAKSNQKILASKNNQKIRRTKKVNKKDATILQETNLDEMGEQQVQAESVSGGRSGR